MGRRGGRIPPISVIPARFGSCTASAGGAGVASAGRRPTAAAGATGEVAFAGVQKRKAYVRNAYLQHYALGSPVLLNQRKLIRPPYDPLGQRKAQCKIVQVRGRGQHHCMRTAVELYGDGNF